MGTTLIIIFVSLVAIYLVINQVKSPDNWIIFGSLLVLIYTLLCCNHLTKAKPVETFANDSLTITSHEITLEEILNNNKTMNIEENIDDISKGLVMYTTTFSSKSYQNMGKVWFNLAPKENLDKSKCKIDQTRDLDFDISPVFSRKSGFYLGNNRLVGPYSNNLSIDIHGTFTSILVVKHGNLLVSNNNNNEIEILKMYANSPNNNALAMYIKRGSLSRTNNVQMGSLMFQYSSEAPKTCLIDSNDKYMHLDKDSLIFYFIVKDIDNIRILYLTEKSNVIHQLLKFNVSNDDITFSNKELIINRQLNWNANIYNFAIYDFALSDDDVTSFYNHVMNEYMKNVDPNYGKVLSRYNSTLDFLKGYTKCPFDKNACDACSSVTSWCDTNQLMLSSTECKKSINEYCLAHSKDGICRCWDKTSPAYNNDSCRLYRSIFQDRESFLNFLTIDDLEYIRKKYKLLYIDECPKILKNNELIKNKYDDYNYNQLKVEIDQRDFLKQKPHDDEYEPRVEYPGSDSKKRTLHPDTPKVITPQSIVYPAPAPNIDPEFERMRVDKASEDVKSITDLYNKDPTFNFDPKKTIAGDRFDEIKRMTERERNANLRIGEIPRPIPDFEPQAEQLPAIEGKNFSASGGKPDSFFSKFIKIMVPS